MKKKRVDEFLKLLGSEAVSPGGGAAAALTAALATALTEMTTRLNDKRAKTSSTAKLAKLVKIRETLAELMRKDTEAFLALTKFPKEMRSGIRYMSALKTAASVPLSICELAHETMVLAQPEILRTSKWLASDLAEAGILAQSAFEAARLNVEINLKYIQDAPFVAAARNDLNEMASQLPALKSALLEVLNR